MMVLAVVRGPTTPTPEQVRAAQESLPSAPGLAKTSLRVRYLPVQVITPEGEINAPDNLVGTGQ